MSASRPSTFLVKVTGQIESGKMVSGDEMYFQYFYHFGPDWKIERGLDEGVSQMTRRSEDERNIFIWNFPIDVTFRSTNPYGWPQIVIVLNGSDFWGREVVRGYTCCHLPITPGTFHKSLKTFVPESASTIQKFVAWISGGRPEFVNPKTIAQGQGREVTRVRSQGSIDITFHAIFKDLDKLGFNCGYHFSSASATSREYLSSLLKDPKSSVTPEGAQRTEVEVVYPTTSRGDMPNDYDDEDSP